MPTSAAESFLDTNLLLYLLSADHRKADRAESIVAQVGVISVQVLNEFAYVATRKLGMSPRPQPVSLSIDSQPARRSKGGRDGAAWRPLISIKRARPGRSKMVDERGQ